MSERENVKRAIDEKEQITKKKEQMTNRANDK